MYSECGFGGDAVNQFKKYEEQLKKDKDIYAVVEQFDEMLNSMWCIYSFESGYTIWRELSRFIDEPFRGSISTEVHHVKSGHGIKQARLALKSEVEKYVIHLIEKYCQ
jgi:hypothetical protein